MLKKFKKKLDNIILNRIDKVFDNYKLDYKSEIRNITCEYMNEYGIETLLSNKIKNMLESVGHGYDKLICDLEILKDWVLKDIEYMKKIQKESEYKFIQLYNKQEEIQEKCDLISESIDKSNAELKQAEDKFNEFSKLSQEIDNLKKFLVID